MAKIYNFERHKLQRELHELNLYLNRRYSPNNEYKLLSHLWFDHAPVIAAQKRMAEIVSRLEEIERDCQTSEK